MARRVISRWGHLEMGRDPISRWGHLEMGRDPLGCGDVELEVSQAPWREERTEHAGLAPLAAAAVVRGERVDLYERGFAPFGSCRRVRR